MKKLLAEFPDKHWPLTTVKRLQRKTDDTAERSTDNLSVEENETLYNERKCSVISAIFS